MFRFEVVLSHPRIGTRVFKDECEHREPTLAHHRNKGCLTRPHTVKYGSQYFLNLSFSISSRVTGTFFRATSDCDLQCFNNLRLQHMTEKNVRTCCDWVTVSLRLVLSRKRRLGDAAALPSIQAKEWSRAALLQVCHAACAKMSLRPVSRLDGDAGQNGAWRATGKMFPSIVLSLRWMFRCWRVADMLWRVIVGWAAVGSSWRCSKKSTMGCGRGDPRCEVAVGTLGRRLWSWLACALESTSRFTIREDGSGVFLSTAVQCEADGPLIRSIISTHGHGQTGDFRYG